MTSSQTSEPTQSRPLRLWPGVAIVTLQWLVRFVIPFFVPAAVLAGVLGGLVGGFMIVLWWLFFSRAAWPERLGAIGLMAVALFATSRLLHESMATAGMGVLFFIYAIPVLCLGFVVWAVASRHLSNRLRRATMVATILLACGVWTLFRTGGITGESDSDFGWRWARTAEERLLAQADDLPTAPLTGIEMLASGADWPGFRGPGRDGIIHGLRIDTDWSASPPVELWRRSIGPGWSSFAIRGILLYTQEQRGDDEVVSCYNATTGDPVWQHRDAARFWESNAGAGPRATPTLSGGRVYTLGATGILNALEAHDGSVVWSRNVATDTGAELPTWGFSASPVVTDELVIAATAGQLVAYDLDTGERRWSGPDGGDGYSSPQLLTIDEVTQVLHLSAAGATSLALADGTLLWEHPWKGYPIVQPALTATGDVLISASQQSGLRRLGVALGTDGWTVGESWTSIRMKPYFSDLVVHRGHGFGFDGGILACIDLKDGSRKWKGGRYGHGQLVLLADQDLLLVLSEKGDLVLVKATPDQFTELARLPAIEGKTWNHPLLVGDLLVVRNAQEMAAFRLSLAAG